MKNRTWKVAGLLGCILALTMGTGTLVRADETSRKITNDKSAYSVLETAAWDDRAAANVETYANVRKTASVKAKKAGIMPKGAAADVISREGEWTKIVSGDVKGYVKTELLVFEEEAKELYEKTYGKQGVVTATSLRIRKAPSMDAGQIGSRPRGSIVKILDQKGDWYRIENGKNGSAYMFAEYIEIKEKTAMTVAEYQKKKATASAAASGGELDLLAAIIQCEAGGESHTGKVAVGAVIMNRVRSGKFPNSISGVVYQRGQFSPVASGKLASVLRQGARGDCYQAARDALNGSNPIGGALYFNSGRGKGQQIGNQHFY